jgi:hypothetical protein
LDRRERNQIFSPHESATGHSRAGWLLILEVRAQPAMRFIRPADFLIKGYYEFAVPGEVRVLSHQNDWPDTVLYPSITSITTEILQFSHATMSRDGNTTLKKGN